MPELPEVETIARALRSGERENQPSILGRTLAGGDVLWPRTLAEPSVAEFSPRLAGQRVEQVTRRGKFLCLRLSQDTVLIHLRMSGDLRVEPLRAADSAVMPLQTHDRLALIFTDGLRLVFNDTRKFGRVWLVRDPQTVLGGLGPEPLDPAFSPEEFARRLRARSRQLKPLLLDQTFIAGLGNIYADEALHAARLHPLTASNQLSDENCFQLWHAIRNVLLEGIQRNGSSIDWVYRGGSYQNQFRAYGRSGEPCPNCGAPIQRILVGQRATHFCPVCQSMPNPPTRG
jgi:formamidopyrimidine-DNA glycosylase